MVHCSSGSLWNLVFELLLLGLIVSTVPNHNCIELSELVNKAMKDRSGKQLNMDMTDERENCCKFTMGNQAQGVSG